MNVIVVIHFVVSVEMCGWKEFGVLYVEKEQQKLVTNIEQIRGDFA